MALAELTLQVLEIRMAKNCLDFNIIKLVLSDVISYTYINANRKKINFVNSRNQLYPA